MRTTTSSFRSFARHAGAALALLAAGCQVGPRPLADAASMPSGEWAVTAIRWGKAQARSPDDVMQRFGQVIRYEPALATSGADSCADPVYLANAMVADRYLHATLGVRATDLGLYRWQDVRITEVYCNGQRWRALGGEVFWVDEERGFAVRDRVLYQLQRRKPAA